VTFSASSRALLSSISLLAIINILSEDAEVAIVVILSSISYVDHRLVGVSWTRTSNLIPAVLNFSLSFCAACVDDL
jgi:hypothetical protein